METFADQFEILPITGSPLDPILSDIDRLFRLGFYYAAIHISLSIPDICSSLETRVDDELRRKVERRYKAWCEKYLQHKFQVFTSTDCWALRGGVIHNGKLHGHTQLAYDRVIFQPPSELTILEMVSENNGGFEDKALLLNIQNFLSIMITAARDWYSVNQEHPIVLENIDGLVRTRPDGIEPHYVGSPIIA